MSDGCRGGSGDDAWWGCDVFVCLARGLTARGTGWLENLAQIVSTGNFPFNMSCSCLGFERLSAEHYPAFSKRLLMCVTVILSINNRASGQKLRFGTTLLLSSLELE